VKKFNRVIGGGAVATAIMLMASAMEGGMARASQQNMLRTREIVVCNSTMPAMKIMGNKEMSSKMKMG
jgi:hypothetical protein